MRKPMTTTLLVLTLGAASLTLAACGQDDSASQTPPEPTATETAPMSDSTNTAPETGTSMEQDNAAGGMSSENMDSSSDTMTGATDQAKEKAGQMGGATEGAADSTEQPATGDSKTAE